MRIGEDARRIEGMSPSESTYFYAYVDVELGGFYKFINLFFIQQNTNQTRLSFLQTWTSG
jgi:hypothetical protein